MYVKNQKTHEICYHNCYFMRLNPQCKTLQSFYSNGFCVCRRTKEAIIRKNACITKCFNNIRREKKKTRNKIVCSNSLVRIYLFSSRILLLFLFNFAFTIHKCNMIFVVYKCVRNFLLADLIKHRSRSFLELKTRIELKMMIIRMILNIHTKNNVFIMVFG